MTRLMGIVNLTPDSFSGDGVVSPELALRRIDAVIEEGASIVDIGAESTRPGATALSSKQEWERLAPVMETLRSCRGKAEFSIDTRHAQVARKAIASGCSWINDVSGGADPEMGALAAESGCKYVIMHSLGVPADPARTIALTRDPVEELLKWADAALSALNRHGVSFFNIILDPGIGFGKSAEQSFLLLKHMDKLKGFGVPVLIGHSRKSFLSSLSPSTASARDTETLIVSTVLTLSQVDYLRVHDVKSHATMLALLARL